MLIQSGSLNLTNDKGLLAYRVAFKKTLWEEMHCLDKVGEGCLVGAGVSQERRRPCVSFPMHC